jgi:hypothetical protein
MRPGLFVPTLLLLPVLWADATPARAQPRPVRAGVPSVTVIDENETVDDVITRVREQRLRAAQAARPDDQGAPRAVPPNVKLPARVSPAPGARPLSRALAGQQPAPTPPAAAVTPPPPPAPPRVSPPAPPPRVRTPMPRPVTPPLPPPAPPRPR